MESQVLLSEIEEGKLFEGVVYIAESRTSTGKTGKEYLSSIICDKSGEYDCKAWDNFAKYLPFFRKSRFVWIKAKLGIFQSKKQFTLQLALEVPEADIPWKNFRKDPPSNTKEQWQKLSTVLESLKKDYWKNFLEELWKEPELKENFITYPAAKTVHHSYPGGLLDHCVSILTTLEFLCKQYKNFRLNTDVVLLGGLLHDIAKVFEFSNNFRTEYTLEGQLIGHIVMGSELVEKVSKRVADLPQIEKIMLKHVILSHHGELNYGSPKVPMTPEAFLVHYVDHLDSKMETISEHRKREGVDESGWTVYNRFLDRPIYFFSADQTNFFEKDAEKMSGNKLGELLKKASDDLSD